MFDKGLLSFHICRQALSDKGGAGRPRGSVGKPADTLGEFCLSIIFEPLSKMLSKGRNPMRIGLEATFDDGDYFTPIACLRSLQYVKLRLLPEGVIMSHSYSSDISREQFARILPCLESARRRTKPRTVDLYDVFCGVLYLLKSGCQWRMLPADFPDWRTCYKYFRQWSERPDPAKYSILEQVLKKIG